MYVKVTDGAVIRLLNMDSPAQRNIYNELLNNNTGYEVVVDEAGKPKEFTEESVKDSIEKALAANNKRKSEVAAPRHKGTADIE